MMRIEGRGGFRKDVVPEILSKLVRSTNERIYSTEFKIRSRTEARHFTRKRKMPFEDLMLYTLNSYQCSIQCGLRRFFARHHDQFPMKQQSFSKARKKIKVSAFSEVFELSVDVLSKFCQSKWHGLLVFGIDGTKIALPDDDVFLDNYGGMGADASSPTAQVSIAYDLLNDVVYDASIEPLSTPERTLAITHIKNVLARIPKKRILIIFDRGYPSFELIKILEEMGIKYLMRVKRKFNNDIDAQKEPDGYVRLVEDGEFLDVRVIKFTLESGELEMLITNVDDGRLGVPAFKKLYFMRWPVETKYDLVKNKLQLENFTSRTVDGVEQDFYAVMYLTNVVAAAAHDAQPQADAARLGKKNKYEYNVNINELIGILKDNLVSALLIHSTKKQAKIIGDIINEIASYVVPNRTNRSVPRNPNPRQSKFHHNQKCNA
jgi:hypothetical protein